MSLRVFFGVALYGTLPVSLVAPNAALEIVASYTPHDWVRGLVEALYQLGSSRGVVVHSVTLSLGPGQYDFTFTGPGGPGCVMAVEVHSFHDHRRENRQGHLEFTYQGPRPSVLLPFWRALRELESRSHRENFDTHWRSPFPSKELSDLSGIVASLKREAGAA